MRISQNSSEFHDLKSNAFSDLPMATKGIGEDKDWIAVSNPDLRFGAHGYGEYLSPYLPYLPLYCDIHQQKQEQVKIEYLPVVDEVCIYINGRWVGYFDEYLVSELLEEAKLRGYELESL